MDLLKVPVSKLKGLNSNKDKFFSIIAHDLLNPLSALIGFPSILSTDTKNLSKEEIEDFAVPTHKLAKRIFDLLENPLLWPRIQTGRMDYALIIFDYETICTKVFDLFEQTAENKGIQLTKKLCDSNNIYADTNMIYTITGNLVSSAIKFTSPNGIINISNKINNEVLQIAISDTGPRIPADVQTNLFKIEVSVSTLGTNREKDTDLGLILCKRISRKKCGEYLG